MTTFAKSTLSILFILLGLTNFAQSIALTSAVGTNNQTLCEGSSIMNISYTIGGGATDALISGSLPSGVVGTYSAGTFTISGTPTSSGTFQYTVSTVGGSGPNATATGVITIEVTPVISVNSPTICEGNTAVLTASGATTYSWGQGVSSNPYTVSPIVTTSYTVTGTSNGGCEGTATSIVTVNPQITPTFSAIPPVCLNSASPILPTSSNNTLPISGTWSPSVSTAVAGTTTYTFTPTSGECANSTTLEIIVEICTPDSNLVVTVIPTSVSQNGTCDGTAEIVISGGDAPFSCVFPNGMNSLTATNLCEGLNSVIVSDANGDTLWLDFIIGAPLNTTSTTNLLDSTIVDTLYNPAAINCVINYLTVDSVYINSFNIESDTSAIVNWSVVSSGIITNYSYTYYMYEGTGVYMITLQIYCPAKSINEFLVSTDQIYFNATFAGIEQNILNSESVSIYPNPFKDQITILLDKNQTSEITISDITGKVVANQKSNEKLIQLDMSNLSSGQYIVSVKSESTIITRKIVK